MKKLRVILGALALAIVGGQGMVKAAEPAAAPEATITHRAEGRQTTSARSFSEADYAAREATSEQVASFEGGAVAIVLSTAAAVILAAVLLLLIL